MQVSTVIMSFNPVPREFSARIEALFGTDVSYYNAAKLKQISLFAGLRELWQIRAEKLAIAIDSETSRPLIGPLSVAAAVTRARSIAVVWPDLHVEPLRRIALIRNVLRVCLGTLRGRRALARSQTGRRELDRVARPRFVAPATGRRILYLDANISLGAPVGGSVGHTAGVIGGLVGRGFSVDYASVKPLPTGRPGAKWLRLEPATLLAFPPELNYYPYAELIESRISQMHRVEPWSFIYQRFSLHNFSGPLLAQRLNIPCVLEFNGSEAWASDHWGTRLALYDEAVAAEKAALPSADLLVTVSDELGDELRQQRVPVERILVYPNCVDPTVFDPARFKPAELTELRDRYRIPRGVFVVGFIGTFGQWHGVDFLAECIRYLAAYESDWVNRSRLHFLLIGDGAKMPLVRKILGDELIGRFVTLTGLVSQTEAPKYLACADLLVSPHVRNADGSEFFGSPTKLFEYMAMERPILASALNQIGDVIAGRGPKCLGQVDHIGPPCGLTFKPGDSNDFRNQLKRLVEDRNLAAELARSARKEVLARYTWHRHVDAILERMIALRLLDRASLI
jgi:glycosyltransferase involved in cell wall biosynthesis